MKKYFYLTFLLIIVVLSSCQSFPTGDENLRGGNASLIADPNSLENSESYLDLDTGTIGNVEAADIRFFVDAGSMTFCSLVPVNGALARYMGVETIDVNDCDDLNLLSPGSIPEVFQGSAICILTSDSRLATVEVTNITINQNGAATLQIRYSVWEQAVK